MASKSGPARVTSPQYAQKALAAPDTAELGGRKRYIAMLKQNNEIIAKVVRDVILAERKRLHAHVEKRLEGALFYKGVFADGTEYDANSLVQHGGTIWVATTKATSKPGTSGQWRLLVKTGRHHDADET